MERRTCERVGTRNTSHTRSMPSCSGCGTEIAPGASFCKGCGQTVPQNVTSQAMLGERVSRPPTQATCLQQPPPQSYSPEMQNKMVMMVYQPHETWNTGFFDCCQHPALSALTCLCPCLTFGQIIEQSPGGIGVPCAGSCGAGCLLFCCLEEIGAGPWLMCTVRKAIRQHYNVDGEALEDFFLSWFFPCCALVQMKTQMDSPGYKPVPMKFKV